MAKWLDCLTLKSEGKFESQLQNCYKKCKEVICQLSVIPGRKA